MSRIRNRCPGDHPLARLNNVTITPHIASSTLETRDAMAVLTAENILAVLAGTAYAGRSENKRLANKD
jgi:phosphoglycerate dehydrogenase-like enzyme